MENWLVMLVAIGLVCLVYPPVLGVLLGAGFVMAATYVVYKLIGG